MDKILIFIFLQPSENINPFLIPPQYIIHDYIPQSLAVVSDTPAVRPKALSLAPADVVYLAAVAAVAEQGGVEAQLQLIVSRKVGPEQTEKFISMEFHVAFFPLHILHVIRS